MTLKAPFDRITIEPGKTGGKPCIRGLRISVEDVLNIIASYPERKELFENYPDLEEGDLKQALAFAATTSSSIAALQNVGRRLSHERRRILVSGREAAKPSVILLRRVQLRPAEAAALIQTALDHTGGQVIAGAAVTVTPPSVRVRQLRLRGKHA